MRAYVSALVAIFVVAATLQVAGYKDAAWAVAWLGTPLVMFATLGWVVALDSRKRWPDRSWLVRLGKVMFFER